MLREKVLLRSAIPIAGKEWFVRDALMRSTDGTFDRFSFCVPGALVLHVTDIKIRALFKRLECNVLQIQPCMVVNRWRSELGILYKGTVQSRTYITCII